MGRILGLDVGDKTIGVAVSDSLGFIAQGVTTIRRRGLDKDLEQLKKIIDQYNVNLVVIGMPKNMNGTIGTQGQKVKDFGNFLEKRIKPNIVYWDERLTSVEAERTLIEADVSRKKRKKVIDKLAATYILQSYLEFKS
ncbi:Holliday junction resolvase RuvX [Garciella nitratireducens]|uniref:Putative pre-16S rRNA nuclease n=1 Tax=Garciella nitratireducens DSM 15102 TaxID=1121911 RepID=A0A1T4JSZ2_9FIRM|nr:Holliday junction resolvase RuvX [Garciella nitratireducens]RBP45542.1 putative Holliday junction resolvase [Garciella nitratireducens]SJZ33263.1 putative holliday junction resolvase [Garciella nitratireducens DSM 15102]